MKSFVDIQTTTSLSPIVPPRTGFEISRGLPNGLGLIMMAEHCTTWKGIALDQELRAGGGVGCCSLLSMHFHVMREKGLEHFPIPYATPMLKNVNHSQTT